jgi:formate dehydrogenase alpha subunit
MCIVEIGERRVAINTACTTPAGDGMVVKTDTEKLNELRRVNLELILYEGNHFCMTCESNGDCELQDLAYKFGIKESEFNPTRIEYPIDNTNPFIIRDLNKCILCRRCIRACDEIQNRRVLNVANRGFETKIIADFDVLLQDSTCEFCGQCVVVCPVGALTPKIAAGMGREWEFKKVNTVCPYCGVGCRFDLNIKDEKIIKITSNLKNSVNGIALCVKGRFGFDFVNHPDRLKHPLIKREGEFKEASWDEALEYIANKFITIKEKENPNAIAVLSSAKCTNEENYLLQKFTRAVLGTNNIDHCARLCHAPTVTGLATAFGSGAMTNSIEDITKKAKAYLIIGSNTTEQHPVIGIKLRKAIREGAKLVVADPRNIDIADMAVIHLKQKPGTDVALLNGLMNVIIDEELWDRDFVMKRTEGFEGLKETVSKYKPKFVEEITGIPADDIVKAARILANNKPASLIYSMGITQHISGHLNVLSCANIQMLLGNIGVEGGGVNPLRGQNNVQGACDLGALPNVYPGYQSVASEENREKFEKFWGVKLDNVPGLTVVEMLNAAENGKIKAMYIMGENPMVSDPDVNHVRKCLESLEILVVQDIFLSETAKLADVVLPAVSFAEKEGTYTNTERRVQLSKKGINTIGESKPDWKIICKLSTKMGYPMNYNSTREIMDEIAKVTPIYAGISHERLNTTGIQWPCPDKEHPGTKILHVGKFSRGLGRFTAVDHLPPEELPDEEYPFILTTGRVIYHWHTGEMTRRSKGLSTIYPENVVEINPEDAMKLNIENGEKVKVISRRGEVEIKANVTEKTQPGILFITFHFPESSANILTISALDKVSKIPELKVCAVTMKKILKT